MPQKKLMNLQVLTKNKNFTKTLAIDPGYERLGIAVIEKTGNKEKVLFSDCFRTDKNLEHADRLHLIGKNIQKIIDSFTPDCISTEKLFFSVNKKTALLVAESRGVIMFIAKENNLPIFEFHPSDIKIAITGSGKADKNSLYKMTEKLIDIKKEKVMDDEIDAVCIGLTFFAHNRYY